MRTLSNYKLLIDKDCPMCQLYGGAFEKTGMIEQGTCSPYQTIDTTVSNRVDMNKARNEIAFYNTQTQEALYRLDALVYIITHNFSFLKPILKNITVEFLLRKLYKFISFNRKIIAPSSPQLNERICVPDLNLKYRLLYVAFVVLVSSTVLFHFTKPINEFMGWENHLGREFLVCLGQLVWQSVILYKLPKSKLLDYLGNMITVSLIGTLLLIPMLLISNPLPLLYLTYFGLVVGFMFFEHVRRCKILGVGWLPSISWLIYRAFVLVIIGFVIH